MKKEYLGGSSWGITRVNISDLVDKVVWLDLSFPSFAFSFSLLVFIFIWSSWTSWGERGFKVTLRPWKEKDIVLDRPSCKTCLSYCQGLSKRTWVASMGTTSHKTSSLYFPIAKFMRTCLLTMISPLPLSHCNL